jgi:carbonic anhydrase
MSTAFMMRRFTRMTTASLPHSTPSLTPSLTRLHSSCCGTTTTTPQHTPPITPSLTHNPKSYHHKAYAQVLEDTDHPDIAKLLLDNKKWVESSKKNDPNFFEKIGGKQVPKYLYIGCSDSRVPANEILGLGPGEVFVHRNVGNLVNGSDLSVLSVIEFAVRVLNVKHIIVTGHYDCGAVIASTKNQDLGLLENWIRNIRDTQRIHKDTLDALNSDDDKHRCLVELSAIEQCYTVFKIGAVQQKRKETALASGGKDVWPQVTAMVFDPKDGLLKKLPINFEKSIEGYHKIYDLY